MGQLSFASGFLIFLPALSSSPDACRYPQLALSSLLQPLPWSLPIYGTARQEPQKTLDLQGPRF